MATQSQPADQPAARKKRGKGLLIGALLLVLMGGGAGGWYYLQSRANNPDAPKPKPAVFLALESFTVNLISDDTQPQAQAQYLQASLTLKLFESGHINLVKDRMPEVRNRILMVLSSKRVKELLSVDGKRKLALEIADAVKDIIAPGSVTAAAAAAAALPAAAAAPAAETVNPGASATSAPSIVGEAQAAPATENPVAEPAQAEQRVAAAPAVESAPRSLPPSPAVEVLFTSFIVQ
jgi:flagellar protein FliL